MSEIDQTKLRAEVKDAIAACLRSQREMDDRGYIDYISPSEHNEGDSYVLSGCFNLAEVADAAIAVIAKRVSA